MLTVSYSGVHQTFQLALAAQEAGLLERFLCSFFDAPGKWGGRLSRVLGAETMQSRRLPELDPGRVLEHPWPELVFKLRQRFWGAPGNAWIGAAAAFDRWAARQLPKLNSSILVGTENCAYESFQAAQRLGWRRIYDCPGYNTDLWDAAAQEAARRLGLPFVSISDTSEVTRRKEVEIGLADVVLCYADFHAAGVQARGVPADRIRIIPLWVDSAFWKRSLLLSPVNASGPLKVLFAGRINLRKGVPFLIEACRKLKPRVRLTLVGTLDPDVRPCLAGVEEFGTVLPPVSKQKLREIYQQHDVLVLPSLGDSFGFVGLEAMACGLPVVVTTHSGVPVPDLSWRVPVMDSRAIANRLEHYVAEPTRLAMDADTAVAFAQQFMPLRYRAGIRSLLAEFAPAL